MDLIPALPPEPPARDIDTGPKRLTQRQKAAVVVRLLLANGVSPGVERLPPSYQGKLARAMQGIGPIDRDTLVEIVAEFSAQLDRLGLLMPRDMSETLKVLDPYISDFTREGLAAEAEIADGTDSWVHLSAMEPERLRPIFDTESAEVCAVLLSKLHVSKAAKLLADLTPERAEVIAHAVALTHTIPIETVIRIGDQLHAHLVAQPRPAFAATAGERMGAVLNETGKEARDSVLEGLRGRDPDYAEDVRRNIFTFEHIPKRVNTLDVPRIASSIDGEALTAALAAGLVQAPAAVEFILDNMSKRMAEAFRDEAMGMPPMTDDEAEEAMQVVITEIRALADQGVIRLRKDSEDG